MSGKGGDDFDPERDLLRRYEDMIETQIETINGIDDKAAYTARLIGILGGLILTAISFAVTSDSVEVSEATAAAIFLSGLGILTLFMSLIFAIMTYLSSKFVYGPPTGLGRYLADYKVDPQEYRNAMLRGYSKGIDANREVVDDNSRRFKRSLASLMSALILLFGSGSLFVLPSILVLDVAIVILIIAVAAIVGRYILREDYLTLESGD